MRVLFLLPLLLVGCSAGTMNLVSPVDSDGIVTITGTIKDASVMKETVYYKARTDRDKQYAKLYKESGLELSFEEVKIGEITAWLPKQISYRPEPRLQPLPNGPSEHPVWRWGEKTVDRLVTLGTWFVGGDVVKDIWSRSAPQYNGPYAPVTDSYNRTAEPFFMPE